MHGYKKLAVAIFSTAINNRSNAIKTLSRSERGMIEARMRTRIKLIEESAKINGNEPQIDRDRIRADVAKSVAEARTDAQNTIQETTAFLKRKTIWHEWCDISPDFLARRMEERDLTITR